MQGHCHDGKSICLARVRVFSSERIPITLSALPINTADHRLFILCTHLQLSFAFLAAHFLGHLAFVALHSTAYVIQKHSISS
jgi:hypothetical protein